MRLISPEDAESLTAYYVRNMEFHREWSPIAPPGYYTVDFQRSRLETYMELNRQEQEYRFGIFVQQEQGQLLIGTISLTGIVRGAFHNGRFGYSIDGAYERKGIMTNALKEVMRFGFHQLGLHRLEANFMPHNAASRRVLQKCGFSQIGYSPRMLRINGDWRDHEMYMILVDDFKELTHNAPGRAS